MSFNHVVVWLDQAEAHVIHFTRDDSETEVIKTASVHQHRKAGVDVSVQAEQDPAYLNEIAAALDGAKEILIVGPGQAKLTLIKHLEKHHAGVADKVVSVETVDHPSDSQLLAFARKYFVKADMMN